MRPQPGGALLCPVLIGRDDLLDLADRRLDAARMGAGHLLFLAGEAGIGKTRLLVEIRGHAVLRGFTVVGVGAQPRDAEVSGSLLADLAATLRRRPAAPAHAGIGAELTQRLHTGGGGGDAYRQRRLLVADLAELVVTLGETGGPILLSLEDLHWADDLTLAVLDRVARRLDTVAMLVVGTYRSDELYPRIPMRAWRTRLLTGRLAEEARLSRLGPDQTSAMAAAIAAVALPAAMTAAVHERSDGIPLHIEEFLAVLGAPGAGGRGVPDTLADAVLARAQDLSEPAREVAGAASVIGRSFDLDLLTAICQPTSDRDTLNQNISDRDLPAGIDAALRELDHRFFVQPRGDGPAYDFRHALIRDALYADLTPHRRRDLHARVATAAATAGFADAFVSDQFERAHLPGHAYRHALTAATEAVTMSAHREAVELYRRAQRTAPSDTAPADQARLLAALAAELAATDDNSAAAGTYAEAYEAYRRLGDDLAAATLVPELVAVRHLLGADLDERVRLLNDALSLLDAADESTQDARTRILAGLSAAYMLDRHLTEAIAYGEQAQDRATGGGDQATRLNSAASLGSALVFAGRMDDGWRLLTAAVTDARDAQLEAEAARAYRMLGACASVLVEYDRGLRWLREGIGYAQRTERFNDRHYMAAHLAHVFWAIGDWAAADREANQALADGHGSVTTRITALHVLGYLAVGRGDWAAAEDHLRPAQRLGEDMRELQRLSPALWGLAETMLHSGRLAEAVAWCERGYAASADAGDAAYLFPFLVTGTRAYLALDGPSAARSWLERCERWILLRSIPGTMPALDHARGLLYHADGRTVLARDTLAAASAGWAARHRFWEGTQVLLDRADVAERSRRPGEASTLADTARTLATAAGATILLARAGAAVDLPAGRAPLTAREVEVARLVATGATNREIAGALFISPKTVAAHIEHILAKLDAARRTEIAAWVTAHGLRT